MKKVISKTNKPVLVPPKEVAESLNAKAILAYTEYVEWLSFLCSDLHRFVETKAWAYWEHTNFQSYCHEHLPLLKWENFEKFHSEIVVTGERLHKDRASYLHCDIGGTYVTLEMPLLEFGKALKEVACHGVWLGVGFDCLTSLCKAQFPLIPLRGLQELLRVNPNIERMFRFNIVPVPYKAGLQNCDYFELRPKKEKLDPSEILLEKFLWGNSD